MRNVDTTKSRANQWCERHGFATFSVFLIVSVGVLVWGISAVPYPSFALIAVSLQGFVVGFIFREWAYFGWRELGEWSERRGQR